MNNEYPIPAADAKGKRPYDVPLSSFALEVIEGVYPLISKSDYIFESPVIDNQPVQELKRTGRHSGV